MESKACVKCKQALPTYAFGKSSRSKDNLRDTCKECRKIEAKVYYKFKDKQKHSLQSIKARAKAQNLEFNLELSDLNPPKVCPVFGVPLEKIEPYSNKTKRFSTSIDRIDPNKGYTKDNIQIISNLANIMKHDASIEELKMFAHWVLNTYN